MRLMKTRVIYLVVMLAALAAPMQLAFDGLELKATPNVAEAACTTPEPTGNMCCAGADVVPANDANGNPVCPTNPLVVKGKNCPAGTVETALPILSGGAKCITNNGGQGSAIVAYAIQILKLVNIAFGLFIILMLVITGVQYMTSLGDPGSVKNAKNRLQNTIIALVLYLSMFAILSFLIPGGIL